MMLVGYSSTAFHGDGGGGEGGGRGGGDGGGGDGGGGDGAGICVASTIGVVIFATETPRVLVSVVSGVLSIVLESVEAEAASGASMTASTVMEAAEMLRVMSFAVMPGSMDARPDRQLTLSSDQAVLDCGGDGEGNPDGDGS